MKLTVAGINFKEGREELRHLVKKVTARMMAAPRKALHDAKKNRRWEVCVRVVCDLFRIKESAEYGDTQEGDQD